MLEFEISHNAEQKERFQNNLIQKSTPLKNENAVGQEANNAPLPQYHTLHIVNHKSNEFTSNNQILFSVTDIMNVLRQALVCLL